MRLVSLVLVVLAVFVVSCTRNNGGNDQVSFHSTALELPSNAILEVDVTNVQTWIYGVLYECGNKIGAAVAYDNGEYIEMIDYIFWVVIENGEGEMHVSGDPGEYVPTIRTVTNSVILNGDPTLVLAPANDSEYWDSDEGLYIVLVDSLDVSGLFEVNGTSGNDSLVCRPDAYVVPEVGRFTGSFYAGGDDIDLSLCDCSNGYTVYGGDGDDTLEGSTCSGDYIYGGKGKDKLIGGTGSSDLCDAGQGSDTCDSTCETKVGC